MEYKIQDRSSSRLVREMDGTSSSSSSSSLSSFSSSSLPANYVTLKDLQERWIKRKQEEAEQERLHKIMEEEDKESIRNFKGEEENKLRKGKQLAKDKPKSGHCRRKPVMPTAAESSDAAARRKAGTLRASLPEETTAEGSEAVSGGHELPARRARMPYGRARIWARASGPRADRTDEIARRVADLSVSGGGVPRTLRGRGYRGRRGGWRSRPFRSAGGGVGGGCMVWVRKSES